MLTMITDCRYDDLKSAQDNIDLQSTILSRFDLIFIVKDERTMETDKLIARYCLMHCSSATAQQHLTAPTEQSAQRSALSRPRPPPRRKLAEQMIRLSVQIARD